MSDECGDPWGMLRQHWTESAEKEKTDVNRIATPVESLAIVDLQAAVKVLSDLGWRPMNGCLSNEPVRVIVHGSSGVGIGKYNDRKQFWLEEAGDLWPATPIMWKELIP